VRRKAVVMAYSMEALEAKTAPPAKIVLTVK
jgi:hypothetical protein